MRQYDAIFWDLDGTIANTFEGIFNCMNYALESYGIKIERQDMHKFIGPPLRRSIPEYCGLTPEQTEDAVRRYRERYIPVGVYECEMFPGVREALAACRNAGCIQVLTSSKPEAQCREILKMFGISDFFDEVVGASPDGKIDTKIQVLQEAFWRMDQREEHCEKSRIVLIGDTRFDAEGARQAGIDCIGVGYGFGTAEEMLQEGAKAVYPDLETLCRNILNDSQT